MQETKWYLDSMAVRGGLLTIVPTFVTILKAFGIEIGEGEANVIIEGLAAIAGLLGAAMAIYGRVRARHTLVSK